MKEEEMKIIASLIDDAISSGFSEEVVLRVRNSVADLCRKFPFYSDFIQKVVS
jgi:glycine/serine hydroxymethyltransferase